MKTMKILPLYITLLFVFFSAFALFSTGKAIAADSGKTWTVRCADEKVKSGRGSCEIYQRLIKEDTGTRFVETAIGYPGERKTAQGIFIVPLGVLLKPGVELQVDNAKPVKFQIRYCDGGGCFGFADLNEALIESMRKGAKMTVTFFALNGKKVSVEMSLEDFSKAMAQVS
jgi:invasion protein IalB